MQLAWWIIIPHTLTTARRRISPSQQQRDKCDNKRVIKHPFNHLPRFGVAFLFFGSAQPPSNTKQQQSAASSWLMASIYPFRFEYLYSNYLPTIFFEVYSVSQKQNTLHRNRNRIPDFWIIPEEIFFSLICTRCSSKLRRCFAPPSASLPPNAHRSPFFHPKQFDDRGRERERVEKWWWWWQSMLSVIVLSAKRKLWHTRKKVETLGENCLPNFCVD